MLRLPLLLLIGLGGACGTLRAVKQGVEALNDDAVERRALTSELRETNRVMREEIAPVVTHTVQTWDDVGHALEVLLRSKLVKGLLAVLALGSGLGYFSLGKTAWRYVKRRAERKRARPS